MTTEELAVWLEGLAGDFDEVDGASAERARCASGRLRELNRTVQDLVEQNTKLWLGRGWVSGYIEALEVQGIETVTLDGLKQIQEVLS